MVILYDKIIGQKQESSAQRDIFDPSNYVSMNAYYNKKTSLMMSHHTIFKHWKYKANSETSYCESWL